MVFFVNFYFDSAFSLGTQSTWGASWAHSVEPINLPAFGMLKKSGVPSGNPCKHKGYMQTSCKLNPGRGSNQGPQCCKANLLTIKPMCCYSACCVKQLFRSERSFETIHFIIYILFIAMSMATRFGPSMSTGKLTFRGVSISWLSHRSHWFLPLIYQHHSLLY